MSVHYGRCRVEVEESKPSILDIYHVAGGPQLLEKLDEIEARLDKLESQQVKPDATIKPLKPDIVTHGGKPSKIFAIFRREKQKFNAPIESKFNVIISLLHIAEEYAITEKVTLSIFAAAVARHEKQLDKIEAQLKEKVGR